MGAVGGDRAQVHIALLFADGRSHGTRRESAVTRGDGVRLAGAKRARDGEEEEAEKDAGVLAAEDVVMPTKLRWGESGGAINARTDDPLVRRSSRFDDILSGVEGEEEEEERSALSGMQPSVTDGAEADFGDVSVDEGLDPVDAALASAAASAVAAVWAGPRALAASPSPFDFDFFN